MEQPEKPDATTDDSAEDFRLMEAVGRGDHQAFARLVERHRNAVVGTVAKMLGNASEAEDLAQRVFLRVWTNAKKYKPDAKFTTYLFTITKHLVFNETRRKGRKREVSVEERGEDRHWEVADRSEYEPDREVLNDELRQAVDRAITALPETQRLAVVLRRYENMPYEDIGTTLNLSVPAVKSLLFRARTALRESLAEYLDESE